MLKSIDDILLTGFYPRVHDQNLEPQQALSFYVETYLERDIRSLSYIKDLTLFQKFLKICAGRCGQRLNLSSIGNEIGVSNTTAREWLSLLEASYIVFLLRPYHKNYNKRITKTPKLYFYDVGLAAYLLGIKSAETISSSFFKGLNYFEALSEGDLFQKCLVYGGQTNVRRSGTEIMSVSQIQWDILL